MYIGGEVLFVLFCFAFYSFFYSSDGTAWKLHPWLTMLLDAQGHRVDDVTQAKPIRIFLWGLWKLI